MKIFKKILKILAVLGVIIGFAKVVCKFCKTTMKMNNYNHKVVFSGASIEADEKDFEKDSAAVLFGGIEVDFEKTKMLTSSSILELFGRFSGIEVTVPDHWQVVMSGSEVNSGVENVTKDNSLKEDAPILNVHYDLKYSGLVIDNPSDEQEEQLTDDDLLEEHYIEEIPEDETSDFDINFPETFEELDIEDFEEDDPIIEIIDKTKE